MNLKGYFLLLVPLCAYRHAKLFNKHRYINYNKYNTIYIIYKALSHCCRSALQLYMRARLVSSNAHTAKSNMTFRVYIISILNILHENIIVYRNFIFCSRLLYMCGMLLSELWLTLGLFLPHSLSLCLSLSQCFCVAFPISLFIFYPVHNFSFFKLPSFVSTTSRIHAAGKCLF